MWRLKLGQRKSKRDAPPEERVVELLRRHGVAHVIDIGANEGQYARRLRAAGFDGDIFSIEPGTDAHARLTVSSNADPRWRILPRLAVTDHQGEGVLHTTSRSDMNSLMPLTETTREAFRKLAPAGDEAVPLRTLDDLLAHELKDFDPSMALLKLDAQGSEAAILRGAERSLSRFAAVQAELSLVPLYEGETVFLPVLGKLDEAGFEIQLLFPGAFSRAHGRHLQVEVFLLHRRFA